MGRPAIDLLGQKFGQLTVKERHAHKDHKGAYWVCACDCGNETVVAAGNLKNPGRSGTKSCGCLAQENMRRVATTHGLSGSREYKSWEQMKSRCFNKNHRRYHRDVTICDRWIGNDGFINFFEDMGECQEGMSLDLYPNNNGNYEPSNCRWATHKEKANNRRNKLNKDNIQLIRSSKLSTTKMAMILGVSQSHISRIRTGKSYAYS